jgi:predicted CopG family antitoxin
MATKKITIDMEAYRRLKAVQQTDESFSQTIKRVVPKPIDSIDGPSQSKMIL